MGRLLLLFVHLFAATAQTTVPLKGRRYGAADSRTGCLCRYNRNMCNVQALRRSTYAHWLPKEQSCLPASSFLHLYWLRCGYFRWINMASGWLRGTVKEVPSGDSVVIVGAVKGPAVPPEKRVTLSSLVAPRLVSHCGHHPCYSQ